jgi:hypothetical protein
MRKEPHRCRVCVPERQRHSSNSCGTREAASWEVFRFGYGFLSLPDPFRSENEATVLTEVCEHPLRDRLVVEPRTGDFEYRHVG